MPPTPLLSLITLLTLPLTTPRAEPLFDVHLHYSAAHAAQFPPQQIIEKLARNDIRHAVISGTPAAHTARLYRQAPERIVPFLGVYRSLDDKLTWPHDETLSARVAAALDTGPWRGIGELHIFAGDRHSPVFRRLVELAAQHRLPLQIHGDPAVIDTVYDITASQPVIWAHAGTFPYPDLLADYLQRYPALRVDLTVRDERIAPQGRLGDEWYDLFVHFPDRFLVGVDTYSPARWQDFDAAVATVRHWLAQLPEEVARQLAYDNAAALFDKVENLGD